MPIWKKILYIVLFLAVAVLFGYLIFRMFFAPTNENKNANLNYNLNGALPNVNLVNRPVANLNYNINGALPNVNGGVSYTPASNVASGGATIASPIIKDLVKAPILASNKKDIIYYDPLTGEFFKISPDGSTKTKLTEDKYPGAENIYWAPGGSKAVITFPDNSKITYDFNLKKQYSLPKETEEFSFSPTAGKIAFKYRGYEEDSNWLAVANPDGTGAKVAESLGEYIDQVKVNWSPNGQIIATYAKGASANEQEIIFLGANSENFPSVKVPGRGFKAKWSPSGDKILFSIFNEETDYNPELWLMDGSINNLGGRQTDLNVKTWPDKCVFGTDDSIYCAVPRFLPSGSDLYPELAENIPDDFYRIDLKTGAKTLLAKPVNSSGFGNYTAKEVFLSSNQEFLYFTDQNTGRLFKIRLK